MRTAVLLVLTLALLAGGFAAYLYIQPKDPHATGAGGAGTIEASPIQKGDGDTTYTVRGGKQVWLKEFDENRRLVNQFRAEEFNPQKEGFVRVKRPEAHFFLKGGQWIRVTGETGDVVVAGLPEGSAGDPFGGMSGGGTGAPSRGRLQQVRIQLYEALDATSPTLDMDMNNAAFDNESFRIFTEGYTDAAGKQVAADQVKVTVRGKYEFDGRGLTIRWNDRDRRLELLEIAHGERLVVKEPGQLGTKMPGAQGKRAEACVQPLPVALVSADPKDAVAAAQTAPAPKDSSTLYSIWFYDNVQVVQAEQTLATGNVIEVFYAMRDTPEKPGSTTAPAPAPAPAEPAKPQSPTTAPAKSESPSSAPAPEAEQQQPVVIYWTGKLRVVPSQTAPPAPLDPAQSAIVMRGLPVVLTRDNVQIRCPSFTYRTADGGVTLNRSDALPQVEIAQFANKERSGKPEVTLFSENVEYAPEQGVATLAGKSRAVFPADEAGTSESIEPAQATWTKQGVARFTGTGSDTVIKTLDLSGDVDVQHPQVSLKSQRLHLGFDPPGKSASSATTKPSSQPVVREVVAEQDVHCVLLDEAGAERELHGDQLQILTATDAGGRLYPRQVKANGNVRALQEGQELSSEKLEIVLAPAPSKEPKPAKQPPRGKAGAGAAKAKDRTSTAVQLERMVATTNVRGVSKDGDVATGDSLVVVMSADGKTQVGLSGKPGKLTNARGTVLASEKIVIPDADKADEAHALGPGSLHAIVEDGNAVATRPAKPKGPPRHIDVTWTELALVNMKLKEDHVQVEGNVHASMPDADGTVNTASGDRILITLADAPPTPTTKPAAKKDAEKKTAAAPGVLGGADVDVMKGRQVSKILLNNDAVVNSKLSAPDGSVLREMQIDSSLLEYHVPQRRLVVPRPGRMLVRDHRPPDAKPTTEQEADGLSGQRGATAFQWADGLDYNGVEQRATMTGDVIVAYKPDDAAEPPVRLRADEVVATFEQKADVAPAPAAPGRGDAAKMPEVQLRSVRAEGNVNVVRGGEELTAPRLVYDPVSHWIRAVGTEQSPAIFSLNGTSIPQRAREFQWNTQTWKIKVVGASGRMNTPPPK